MTARAGQRLAWQTRFRTEKAGSPPGRRVHLQIAELEFRGVGRSAANRITAAFESELGLLLASRGVPGNWHSVAAAGDLRSTMGRQRTDYATGEALANAVWESHRVSPEERRR